MVDLDRLEARFEAGVWLPNPDIIVSAPNESSDALRCPDKESSMRACPLATQIAPGLLLKRQNSASFESDEKESVPTSKF
jgi:hypothetical protein